MVDSSFLEDLSFSEISSTDIRIDRKIMKNATASFYTDCTARPNDIQSPLHRILPRR